MDKRLQGKIVKGVAGVFQVRTAMGNFRCSARGILKRGEEKLYVGDNVVLCQEKGVWYVADVLPRKNLLTRPYVSNVDVLLILVAATPAPDYALVDKLLVFCEEYGIRAQIVVNKCDESDKEAVYAEKTYGAYYPVSRISAQTGEGVEALAAALSGNVCLAGQSAVGKTSLMNALLNTCLQVGGLSKIQRGRNTTRHIEIYAVREDLDIYDTCGFSLLSLEGFDEAHLALYYPDFTAHSAGCKFSTCTHTQEPVCAVKDAVKEGKIDKDRYQRYLEIFNEIQENRRKAQ